MDRRGQLTLFAASLMAMALGQVHSFSVFLASAEERFDASRSAVGFSYSLALITLTLAVLWGPRIYGKWSTIQLSGIAFAGAIVGLLIAGFAPNLIAVWIGYGVIFGVANGIGYGFGLQIAAQANPASKGMAMGTVTAAYALGAVVTSPILGAVVGAHGFTAGMLTSLVFVAASGVLSLLMFVMGNAVFVSPDKTAHGAGVSMRVVAGLWLGYGTVVLAGLMVIGHASGILVSRAPDSVGWVAPILIAIFNLIGSFVMALASDRTGQRPVLVGMAALTFIGLAALFATTNGWIVLPMLCLLGFAYGGTIAVWPAAIANRFGLIESPVIYGRVFTAWGTAGLIGPWIAGRSFDLGNSYQTAFGAAAGLAILGMIMTARVLRTAD